MYIDLNQLSEFYATIEGRLAKRVVLAALSRLWHPLSQERLVGFGYALPYLEAFGGDAERVCNFMPASMGSVAWPMGDFSKTALVFEEDLPLADASIDRLLVVHGFEHCDSPRQTLEEMWRVLTPSGRLVLVVPNRIGLWMSLERNPFGWGRPWSRGQLMRILREANFAPSAWNSALHFPPTSNRFVLKIGLWLERLGNKFLPAFGGVLIVEAHKELYQGVKVKSRRRTRGFIPSLTPQNVS